MPQYKKNIKESMVETWRLLTLPSSWQPLKIITHKSKGDIQDQTQVCPSIKQMHLYQVDFKLVCTLINLNNLLPRSYRVHLLKGKQYTLLRNLVTHDQHKNNEFIFMLTHKHECYFKIKLLPTWLVHDHAPSLQFRFGLSSVPSTHQSTQNSICTMPLE